MLVLALWGCLMHACLHQAQGCSQRMGALSGASEGDVTWKKVAAAALRGVVYVLVSPVTLFCLIVFAFVWAFEMKDEL